MSEFRIVPFSRAIDLQQFDAGVDALTEYLKKYARQNQDRGIGRTYVLTDSNNRAIGYYVVSMAEVSFASLPDSVTKRVPRYPLPSMRIGRLAVDHRYRGQKLGELLLVDALQRAVNLFHQVGLFAVIVDAKDAVAEGFYEHFGFKHFVDRPASLFLPMGSIVKAFES